MVRPAICRRALSLSKFINLGSLNSYQSQSLLQPVKEFDPVQQWIEPAVCDAVVRLEWLGMVKIMVRWFQDQPQAL